MGAFSGPDAFKWLHLTPEATAVLQADPFLFAELLIVLFGLSTMFVIAWYIHFVTSKVCPCVCVVVRDLANPVLSHIRNPLRRRNLVRRAERRGWCRVSHRGCRELYRGGRCAGHRFVINEPSLGAGRIGILVFWSGLTFFSFSLSGALYIAALGASSLYPVEMGRGAIYVCISRVLGTINAVTHPAYPQDHLSGLVSSVSCPFTPLSSAASLLHLSHMHQPPRLPSAHSLLSLTLSSMSQ